MVTRKYPLIVTVNRIRSWGSTKLYSLLFNNDNNNDPKLNDPFAKIPLENSQKFPLTSFQLHDFHTIQNIFLNVSLDHRVRLSSIDQLSKLVTGSHYFLTFISYFSYFFVDKRFVSHFNEKEALRVIINELENKSILITSCLSLLSSMLDNNIKLTKYFQLNLQSLTLLLQCKYT